MTAEELKKEFGKPLEEIMADLFPGACKGRADKAVARSYSAIKINGWRLRYAKSMQEFRRNPGNWQRDIKKYVSSATARKDISKHFLKNTGLETRLQHHTCPGDTGKLKYAENIRLIMERNGIRKAIYVGDTQGMRMPAGKADIPMIRAEYGFGEVEGDYKRIKTFYELLELV